MRLKDLVTANRSYRRFIASEAVGRKVLEELVDLGRLSASGQNLQPLKYFLSDEPGLNGIIFDHLAWAGYLKDWPGPPENERPSAYIIVLGDRSIGSSFEYDCGIAAQSIRLGGIERGLGSCLIASIRRKELAEVLDLSDRLEILLAIAIGKPKERVVLEPVGQDGDIKYWRDINSLHHVPKRQLGEIIVN